MRCVGAVQSNHSEIQKRVVQSKSRACRETLGEVWEDWSQRTAEFRSGQNALSFPSPITWGSDAERCFKLLYDSRTQPLAELKEEVRTALEKGMGSSKCPYCLISKGRVFDHFLDKDTFPEYAIEPSNLVYVCSECNEEKNWSGENGANEIIFPYFDNLPNAVFLKCHIDDWGGIFVPRFEVEVDEGILGEQLAFRVQRHFYKLKLKQRFEAEVGETASDFIAMVRSRYPDVEALTALKEIYEEEFALKKRRHGANYYLCRLYRALIQKFLEF